MLYRVFNFTLDYFILIVCGIGVAGVSTALYFQDPYVGEAVESGGLAVLALIYVLANKEKRLIVASIGITLGLLAVVGWFI